MRLLVRWIIRITSYNVCYTKLLREYSIGILSHARTGQTIRIGNDCRLRISFAVVDIAIRSTPGRITSYNVCYTKLLRQKRLSITNFSDLFHNYCIRV